MHKTLIIGWNIFWFILMFFFAIPFPMIIYYTSNGENDVSWLLHKDPVTSLVILRISVMLWVLLIAGYFKNWILSVFIAKRNIEQLKADGLIRQAEIISSEKISKPGTQTDEYDLRLSFKNLVDTSIMEDITMKDIKPYERRFERGRRVEIIIDKSMKRKPYFIIASTQPLINIPVLVFKALGWVIFLALVAGYYLYVYEDENNGAGWRFLSVWHPLIFCPAILFFYRFLARLINHYVNRVTEKVYIKFKGIRTTARLLKVAQTGVYINEQPQINFELEYTDHRNQSHHTQVKRTISLLHLDMTKQKWVDIFYLPEDPKRVAFATDLEQPDK